MLAFNRVLQCTLSYFKHFDGYLELIEGTVAKIRAKLFIRRLLNQFYVICCSIFNTLEVILSGSKVLLPRYGQKRVFPGF